MKKNLRVKKRLQNKLMPQKINRERGFQGSLSSNNYSRPNRVRMIFFQAQLWWGDDPARAVVVTNNQSRLCEREK